MPPPPRCSDDKDTMRATLVHSRMVILWVSVGYDQWFESRNGGGLGCTERPASPVLNACITSGGK